MLFPRSRSTAVWSGILVLLVVAFGCRTRERRVESSAPSILIEAIFSEPASFDPRAQVDSETYDIMYALYNTLVELDDEMQIVPALAESWESEDYQTWTFHLRNGVLFHRDPCFENAEQTREVTAEDIVFSLNRALAPGGVGAFMLTDVLEGAAAVNAGEATTASGLRVLDDRTLELKLLKPYRQLLERLAAPFFFVVAPEAVEVYGEELGRHPVGTGPYRLAAIETGRAVRLERNPDFWKRDEAGKPLPYLDGVRYRVLNDPQVALSEFRAGRLDAIEVPATIAGTVFADGALLPAYARYQKLETVALDVHYFAFRMDRPPFAGNLALREALNYAVDKERIAAILLNGLARPSIGVLPPGVYPETTRHPAFGYDAELARQRLREAGFPGGDGLPELTLAIDDKATTEAVAQVVQSNLADIGVKVALRKSDFNTLLAEVAQGTLDFFYLYWGGTDPNAEIFMVQFKSDLAPETGGYNFGRYTNEKADALYSSAVAELNEEKSRAKWLEMNELVTADAPWIFLYHTKKVRLVQPGISGYEHNPVQIKRFATARKER